MRVDIGNLGDLVPRQGRFGTIYQKRVKVDRPATFQGSHARVTVVSFVTVRKRKTAMKSR